MGPNPRSHGLSSFGGWPTTMAKGQIQRRPAARRFALKRIFSTRLVNCPLERVAKIRHSVLHVTHGKAALGAQLNLE